MPTAAWDNKFICINQSRSITENGFHTMTAPDGYRVVSGGHEISDWDHVHVVSSYPQFGSSAGTNTVANDSWTWEFVSVDTPASVGFYILCEKYERETLQLQIDYGV